jgi:RNA polymerase subunit RPABC4/transcription elongation factor Spt4
MNHILLPFLFAALLIFVLLFLYLGQALWVYQDSKYRGDDFALLWALLCLTNFPVPLIIYILVTRYGKRKCNNCNKRVDKYLMKCPYCGEAGNNLCLNCGHPIETDWNYCPNCNEKIK